LLILSAVSSVTPLPLRKRTQSFPSFTACRPNVDSAIPCCRQNSSISSSKESAEPRIVLEPPPLRTVMILCGRRIDRDCRSGCYHTPLSPPMQLSAPILAAQH